MSYTVLARRYRSNTFDEVIGQDHVAQTLKKAIESNRIAHAYLFTGTRGTGKTSMARILAKALNCEKSDGPTVKPCLKCKSCEGIARGEDIDVIEIDAASNTQVEKTREVILDNAQYRPARSRFKIYIIDEVHMLSKSSFNALLKTLEEPPSHVKFILATTEPEKVLPTILSRCQRYDFRNISTREIAAHLKAVCKEEKIKADEDALMLVAKAGAGSMRDALSLLDRLLSIGEKHLTVETIEQLLGLPRGQAVFDLMQAVGEGRVKDVLTLADRIINEGLSADALIASLTDHLRNLLLLRTCGPESSLVEAGAMSVTDLAKQAGRFEAVALSQDITVLEELRRQIRQSQAGRALLDATLVRLALAEQFTPIEEVLAGIGGGASGAVGNIQKKKSEPVVVALDRSVPGMGSAGGVAAAGVVVAGVTGAADAAPAAVAIRRAGAMTGSGESGAAKVSGARPQPPPHPALSPEYRGEGENAVPGKLTAPGESGVAKEAPNVEPVSEQDLPAVWRGLLEMMQQHGPALHSLVSHGRLVGIEEGRAVIKYGPEHETLPKLLGRNGKKELVSDAFSRLLGRSIGVSFELDTGSGEESAAGGTRAGASTGATASERPARLGGNRARRTGEEEEGAVAAVAAPTSSGRLTPEQLEEFRKDPLIAALISEFGATILKIAEE